MIVAVVMGVGLPHEAPAKISSWTLVIRFSSVGAAEMPVAAIKIARAVVNCILKMGSWFGRSVELGRIEVMKC
jgi:hypothetical protein